MTNPNQDVKDILRAIVNDLEKTSAGLTYISRELGKLVPASMVDQRDGLGLALQEHKQVYDKLRADIEAL